MGSLLTDTDQTRLGNHDIWRVTSSASGPGPDREGEVPGGGQQRLRPRSHPGQRHQDWRQAPPATAGLSPSTGGGEAVFDPDEAGAEPNNNKHFGKSFHEK